MQQTRRCQSRLHKRVRVEEEKLLRETLAEREDKTKRDLVQQFKNHYGGKCEASRIASIYSLASRREGGRAGVLLVQAARADFAQEALQEARAKRCHCYPEELPQV